MSLFLSQCQCKKQNQLCSGKSTGTQVESCKMCAGTCHLTAFCSHIKPKMAVFAPARRQKCAGT